MPDEIFRAAVGANNELVIARLERLAVDGQPDTEAPSLERMVFQCLAGLFRLPARITAT
jgi:hypothetical protein